MITSETKTVEFYIVDFDRTLVDSDKLIEVFTEIASGYLDIPAEQMQKANADIKARGDWFDAATFVKDFLAEQERVDDWATLEKQFIHESRSLNYLLPGAAELLEWLASNGKRYGILTYGNPLWQKLKLTAAGFNHVHHIVMEQKEKGKFISSWQRQDGSFRIPDALGKGTVDRVIMIDDKAVSFTGFPAEPSRGFWVLDPEHELPSQKGTVQSNVSRLSDMQSVIATLESSS